jgi:hypothetical protein
MACNPITTAYFLTNGMTQPKLDPPFDLFDKNKKKSVKVVILASAGQVMPTELIGVDRTLTQQFSKILKANAEANKMKLEVVPAFKVEKYKSENSSWRTTDPSEVGEHFGADFVIDLEINAISLFKGRTRMLYEADANITVKVIDVRKPDEGPVFEEQYTCHFPRSSGPVPVDDVPIEKFKAAFLTRIATDLAWMFTPHAVEDAIDCDRGI